MNTFVCFLSNGRINRYLYAGHHHYVPFNRNLQTALLVNFISAALIIFSAFIGLKTFILTTLIVTLSDFFIHRLLLDEPASKAVKGLSIDIPILLPLFVETFYRALMYPIRGVNVTTNIAGNKSRSDPTVLNNAVSNWHGNVSFCPSETYWPSSKEEAIEIIEKLFRRNKKVRVLGANLSYSPLATTEDMIIHTDGLNKILQIDFANKLVEVEAGISFNSLSTQLAESGLQLPAMPEIEDATVGGCLATTTHGSNTNGGFFFDILESATLVLANGQESLVDKASCGSIISAIKCSMGAIAFVYSVTLRVEPFHLTDRSELLVDEEEIGKQWSEWKTNNKNVTALWWPCLHRAIVITLNPSQSKEISLSTPLYWLLRSRIGNQLLLLLSNIHHPFINHIIGMMFTLFVSKRLMIRPHHQLACSVQGQRLFQNIESEWYFPQSKITEVLEVFGAHYRQLSISTKHNNFCCVYLRPIEAIKDSPALLFPESQEDWIGVMCWVGGCSPGNMAYLDAATSKLYQLGGIPHNGKYDPWSTSLPLPQDGKIGLSHQQLQTFQKIRNELDPTRMFSNAHIEQFLGG